MPVRPAVPPSPESLDPHVLRDLAPLVLGAVIRRFGDFAAAEDAVQEALMAASQQWPREGLPDNPRGWLIQVATRRLTDRIRSESARRRREAAALQQEPADARIVPAPDADAPPQEDDSLLLLFMCCHPSLTTSSAIALTLRAVGGLTTGEIARAYLVPEATMAQRISRAKARIRDSGVGFRMPTPGERSERLAAVLHVLYLVFNEGYASSSGTSLLRSDLANEALRLTRGLRALLPDHAESAGLLALMLLTDARRRARIGPAGELIPLQEQDRSLWDREAIDEGTALIAAALARGTPGPYQIQAAVAALHDEAPTADATDWPQIEALYGVLLQMSDNPMAALSHAIAAAMVHGPREGLTRLDRLAGDPRLAGHYRLDAARAHLHEMAGDASQATTCYRRAASRTSSGTERDYLLMRAARLEQENS